MKVKLFLTLVAVLAFYSVALGQENNESESHKKHSFTLSIGHTHVGEGIRDQKKNNLILPSWGFNYDFHINERWAIGLHNDLIIEEFEVEIEDKDQVLITAKRTRPVSMAITGSYRLNKFLIVSAGAGREFAPEEDFTIFRLGLEPYFELPNNFEIVGTFAVDFRVDAYNAFNLGLGVAKKF